MSSAVCPSDLLSQLKFPCFRLSCLFLVHLFFLFPSLLSRSARLGHSRADAGWTSSDQIRVVVGRRNPNGRWMTEQNRQWSSVGLGRPPASPPSSVCDGRARADEGGNTAPQHGWMVGWFNEPVKISASCIATRKSVGQGREREALLGPTR